MRIAELSQFRAPVVNNNLGGILMRLIKRLKSAWQRHTLGSFFKLFSKNIGFYISELLSGRLIEKRREISEFDVGHDSDTDKIREIGSLDIESENVKHAKRYQPSPQEFATRIINSLPIDHREFFFLDFGAGKGRVLLIAAQLPFAAVIGIEFSKELCAVANDNINRMSPEKQIAARLECHYEDATRYLLPEVPLVCYFYNPFNQLIMHIVLGRLLSSLRDSPREIYIIYVEPKHRNVFDSEACFDVVEDDNSHVVYHTSRDRLAERIG